MAGLGLTRKQAVVCVLVSLVGTVVVFVSLAVYSVGTCILSEPHPAWAWSPRTEFCEGETRASKLILGVLVLPTVLAILGTILWAKVGTGWATLAFGLILATPFVGPMYIDSLPYYYVGTTPVLYNPYLRVATDSRPARACYAYGIIRGRRTTVITPDTERVCVDLEQTSEARALTPEYDQGVTEFGLEFLGHELTENGMDVGTEFDGLIVARVYRLPGAEARRDSALIPIYHVGL